VRILFVTHSFPRVIGAPAGSFLLRLASALADRSVEVHVLAPGAPGLAGTERLDGIPVRRFRYAPRRWETLAYTGTMVEEVRGSARGKLAMLGFLASGRASLAAAVRELRPTVVHAHWWFPAGLIASALRARSSPPLVTTLHGTDVRLARAVRASRPLFTRVVGRSAAVTTVSRFLADGARSIAPMCSPIVAPMPAATELFQLPPDGSVRGGLLFVGRLNAQKGIADLLRALALVPGVSLDVVGEGPDRGALDSLARSLAIDARVRWHGALRQEGLPALYGSAAAVVVPSLDEGLGLVAVEASLCGAPVIAYRSGGLLDVVEDAVTGHLVEPGNPDALAGAIRATIADSARAAAMGRAGRERMLATFAPAGVAERYERIYREVAGRDPGASRGAR
jgi:glycosyltransferase involved in cell wall biosynthesis